MFDWDEKKNKANFDKHKIRFEDAKEVFSGHYPSWTFPDAREDYNEDRFITIGPLSPDVMLVVVHTQRNGKIRIISARKANQRERRKYYEYLEKKTMGD
ncbi:MAG: BrnT family toxin [Methylococcales bacterium]